MRTLVRWLLLLGLLAALVACSTSGGSPAADSDVLEMRAYSVPVGLEDRVVNVLSRLMIRGEERIGRAITGSEGVVMVMAPAELHPGVTDLIKRFEQAESGPRTARTIEVTYWLILGYRADEAAKLRIPEDGRLHEVHPVLQTIRDEQGLEGFELLERFKATSNYGETAEVSGRFATVKQYLTRRATGIVGELEIRLHAYSGNIDTRINLEPDRFLVIGEAGVGPRGTKIALTASKQTLFYVMRARVVDA